jgi:hypothetical protein
VGSNRLRVAHSLLVVAALTVGCGGSGPSPARPNPDPPDDPLPPAGTVVTLRSGETLQPVAGAAVVLSGGPQAGTVYTTDSAGEFRLDAALLSAPPSLTVTAQGFLVRSTIFRPDETTLSLWPASSLTGLDEAFTSTIVYSPPSCPAVNTGLAILRKVPAALGTVQVSFESSLQDAAAEAAHREAITRLNAALGGAPQYQFSTTAGTGVPFTAAIDPNAATCTAGPEPLRAATFLNTSNGNIVGGRLVYCTVAAARSIPLVLHELGHSFGLRHSASQSDVMYCSSGRPSGFSPRETLAMKLMGQRRSGTLWPDNDRQAAGPLAHGRQQTEVIACGS